MGRFLTAAAFSAALSAALSVGSAPAFSAGKEATFFDAALGEWSGGGEIVAGKYKGTKFRCVFNGLPHENETSVEMDGTCRVGLFSQPMNAVVTGKNGRYEGEFLDGALGKGLDITAGVAETDHIMLTLKRGELDGAMLARLVDRETMNVTISVQVGDQLVPVIGVGLKRVDTITTSSVR